jgi:uncharacterized caspase-like protein
MSLRITVAVLAAMLSLAVQTSSAFAGKLVALSIGVSEYTSGRPLPSPANDALAVAGMLAKFGYDVRLVRNPTSAQMRDAVTEFIETARNADVAIVYFSGHGQQVNGESYFVPSDGGAGNPFADYLAVSAIVAKLQAAGVKTNIVFVDACRSNPFLGEGGNRTDRVLNANAAERNILGPGVMVSFASAAGENSTDSLLAYSTYTQALLTVLHREQRLELSDITRATRQLMLQRADANLGSRHTPFEVSSLIAPVYFERSAGGRVQEFGRYRPAR